MQIKNVMESNNIKRIVAYKPGLFESNLLPEYYGAEYSFQDGYVNIFDGFNFTSYNLAFPREYKVRELPIIESNSNATTVEKTMILVFQKEN